ncbi:unnamed protein product [uncultured bacterium]|nr:unnamed protein product [uncultured bacterium]
MAPERVILCGSPDETAGPVADPDPVRLRAWGPDPNVHLTIEDLRQGIWREIPDAFEDLIDLAAYVYAADQAVGRGGAAADDLGAGWRRDLTFRVAVRRPDLWRSKPVHDALVSTLSFLSEDEYRFEFVPMTEHPDLGNRIAFDGTAFDGVVEEVVMFSGGLDSLAGAVREAVLDRRKVLLVNHRSTEKRTPRHYDLVRLLRHRAGDAAPLHVAVRVNKVEKLSREYTQRARSFLFAALGATFAHMIGLDRFRFYENGVVSLNLPISPQVVGARASRTTHPRVLRGFESLLTALAGRPFVVENPFLWHTKTDVVRLIGDAGCGELIGHSTSCGHTWVTTREQPHCGDCSQCIDRRFAVLAAGLEAHDPAGGYGVDLLAGERPEGQSRVLLAAYLETANHVGEMSELEFFGRFGEAGRVLRHLGGNPDETARRVYGLYRRHADQVNGVVTAAIAANADAIRRRSLPATCLVRLVSDGGSAADEQTGPTEPAADYLFRRRGQAWVVRFAGGPEKILLPSKGAAYLHQLLSRPDTAITPADLACQVARRRREFALGDAGEQADPESLAAYRARAQDLREELDRAREDNDPGAVARIESELEALRAEIRRAAGRGGRIRKAADDRERVRKAVGAAIHRAIGEIREFDSALAEHLKQRVKCGLSPRYTGDQGIRWET